MTRIAFACLAGGLSQHSRRVFYRNAFSFLSEDSVWVFDVNPRLLLRCRSIHSSLPATTLSLIPNTTNIPPYPVLSKASSPELSSENTTVDLYYVQKCGEDSIERINGFAGRESVSKLYCCILLHGMLGSSHNFRSFCPLLPFSRIILPDLRNHGKSPTFERMHIGSMGDDVVRLMDSLKIERSVLIGHSMGGKVAMATALQHPSRVTALGVLDIPPGSNKFNNEEMVVKTDQDTKQALMDEKSKTESEKKDPRTEVRKILSLMCDTPLESLLSKEEVESWFGRDARGMELSKTVRQFLLQSLSTNLNNGKLEWIPKVQILRQRFEDDLLTWPFRETDGHKYYGPTIFIKGSKSLWIEPHHVPVIRHYFPNASLASVKTGHWVHHEDPRGVARLIKEKLLSIVGDEE